MATPATFEARRCTYRNEMTFNAHDRSDTGTDPPGASPVAMPMTCSTQKYSGHASAANPSAAAPH